MPPSTLRAFTLALLSLARESLLAPTSAGILSRCCGATATILPRLRRDHALGSRFPVGLLALLLMAVAVCGGCGDTNKNSNKTKSDKRVFVSTGKFNQGYKDGQRDAKFSLMDVNGNWMWLWMTENEYQQGYEQGWRDGRAMVKLEQEKKQNEKEQASENVKPPPPVESSDNARTGPPEQ